MADQIKGQRKTFDERFEEKRGKITSRATTSHRAF